MAKTFDPILLELFPVSPSKSDLRKIEIIDVAIQCLASYGLEGTTLDVIGKRLKISRSHVAYYFPEKDKLLEAVIQFITGSTRKVTEEYLAKANTPQEKLRAVVDGLFAWAEKFPEHSGLMLLFYFQCSHNKVYRHQNTKLRENRYGKLVEILESFPNKKKTPLSNEELAKTIQVTLYGFLQEHLTTDPENRPWNIKDLASKAVFAQVSG